MQVGDKLRFTPYPWTRDRTEWGNGMTIPTEVAGRVVYVHPKGRYYLAEGEVAGRTIRECYCTKGE